MSLVAEAALGDRLGADWQGVAAVTLQCVLTPATCEDLGSGGVFLVVGFLLGSHFGQLDVGLLFRQDFGALPAIAGGIELPLPFAVPRICLAMPAVRALGLGQRGH